MSETRDLMRTLLEQALASLGPVDVPPAAIIADPGALDAALASAVPGAVLALAPELVYPGLLTLHQPVTLCSHIPPGRMTADRPLPRLTGGLRIPGDDVILSGIDVRHSTAYTDIVQFSGARVMLDRVRVLGDPVLGAKRGIAANGGGACIIRGCYVDDCFYPGFEAQAINASDMAPGLLIEDCFLRAAGETIFTYAANAPVERLPADIDILDNTITAKPEWMGTNKTVKTRLELKAGKRIRITGNVIEYAWRDGQDGFLVTFTVRNQDNLTPWATIEDVEFSENDCAHGAGAINILGADDNHPSGRMARVNIHHNTFADITPTAYQQTGVAQLIKIGAGPVALTLDANTFEGSGLNTQVFFYGAPKCEQLIVTNNRWPAATYGIFGDNSSTAAGYTWNQYVASGTLSGNVVTG